MSERSVSFGDLGMGSALGAGVEEFWSNLLAGKSGFRIIGNIRLPKRGGPISADVLMPPRKELDSVNPVLRRVELAGKTLNPGTLLADLIFDALDDTVRIVRVSFLPVLRFKHVNN